MILNSYSIRLWKLTTSYANPGNRVTIRCDLRLDLTGPTTRHFTRASE